MDHIRLLIAIAVFGLTGSLAGVVAGEPPPPLVGFNFTTAASTTPDPQNWTRISAADGHLSTVQNDQGEVTPVGITWGGGTSGGFVYLATSTLATDAVPQYAYDLSGMTGYGFRINGGELFISLSGLEPDTEYDYWFVAYRGATEIENVVTVSEGNVSDAFEFRQSIATAVNDGRFVINDTISHNSQHFLELAFRSRSSDSGTLEFNWFGDGATTVIAALALREAVAPDVIFRNGFEVPPEL